MDWFYGRRNEFQKLERDFERVQKGGIGAVLVSGPAGTGKTALITFWGMETEKKKSALFVYAKADTLHSQTPFSSLAAAMDILVKKILIEHPDGLNVLAVAVRPALGSDLAMFTGLIPALAHVFKTKPGHIAEEDLIDHESVNLRLLSLLEALACLHRPLVLFWDDLQWMDEASHLFLRHLAVNGLVPNIMIILAFRDEKIADQGVLKQTVDLFCGLSETKVMALPGLNKRDTRGLLRQRLKGGITLNPMADICHIKTGGNPLYLARLLDDLLDKGVLRREKGDWVYDISYVSDLGFTDNVVDLIIDRLRLLERDSLTLLKHAACIQSEISISALGAVSGFSNDKIGALLWKPVRLDLLREKNNRFVFAHDRILEAVTALLTQDETENIHRRLVAFYLEKDPAARDQTSIFTLLYHYGFYSSAETDPGIRKKMAFLYYKAGKASRSRSAYAQALEYFDTGKTHFPGDIWTKDYPLALKFCRHLAECAYLARDYDAADQIFAEAGRQIDCFSDRLDIEMVKIPCYQARKKPTQALDAGLAILNHLGIHISKNPSRTRVLYEIYTTWARFILTPQNRLVQKKMVPGTDAFFAFKCLNALESVGYFLSPQKVLPLVTAAAFKLILRHGNMDETPVTYILFGMILNGMTGTVKWGRKLGSLARQVGQQFDDPRLKTKEMTLDLGGLEFWDKPLAESIEDIKTVETFCLRQGDHEYFCYNAIYHLHCLLITSTPLGLVKQKILKKKKIIKRLNNRLVLTMTCFIQQAVDNLEKGVKQPWIFNGDFFDETRQNDKDGGFSEDLFHLYKFFMAFYCGRLDIALGLKQNVENCIEVQKGTNLYHYFSFLSALADIHHNREPKKIKRHLKKLKKLVACNEAVYGNKYKLALGESLRVKGNPKASTIFKEAEFEAQKYGFGFEQALACEGLGKIAREKGDRIAEENYFARAVGLCRKWGLKWRHGLFERQDSEKRLPKPVRPRLDSPIVSTKERVTDNLTDDMLADMKIVSGAQVIHVAVQTVKSWKSKVYINATGIHRPEAFVPLPDKILSLACTTHEVILADADNIAERFFDPVYFRDQKPLSIMVIPGKNANAVYLENFTFPPDTKALSRYAKAILSRYRAEPADPFPLSEEMICLQQHCRTLQNYMDREKVFQNPSLALADVAKDLELSRRVVTNVINTCMGQNFHTFIKNYRIDAVKQAILSEGNRDKTLLEMAFAAGFGSKSSFNDTFKKHVGMTPSQFRQRQCKGEYSK